MPLLETHGPGGDLPPSASVNRSPTRSWFGKTESVGSQRERRGTAISSSSPPAGSSFSRGVRVRQEPLSFGLRSAFLRQPIETPRRVSMPTPLSAEAMALIDRPNFAHLATLMADGSPHIARATAG